jgi:stearoyl-CoA desaturase (Delta-9 desaturase)
MEKRGFNWGPGLFLIIYQTLLIIGLPFYFYYASLPSLALVIVAIILFYLTGLSITVGYHRLYSHRAYRTNPIIESLILFFGAMAGQGSVLRWAFDHRLHHAHVDTDEDPYSINKGFWYAHFLWILEKPLEIEAKVVPDLMRNPLVQFQHRYIELLMIGTNILAWLCVGWLLNDYLGAFVIALWLRVFVLHHSTWFINSLAHTWGDKPFCQEQSAVNNYVIALLTFGEGYHNYHHTFANDYRNGIRWYHFDPSKWLIWTLSKLGLANHLKQIDAYTINKRMVIQRQQMLLERLCQTWTNKKDELEQKVIEIAERLVTKIAEIDQLRKTYYTARLEKKDSVSLKEVKKELAKVKRSFKEDWRVWKQLSENILSLTPIPS